MIDQILNNLKTRQDIYSNRFEMSNLNEKAIFASISDLEDLLKYSSIIES